ncbi:hypothetical protein COT03_00035 [Candidatus Shapirobacteria bacterium CG07_land_8_20_14_0_80_39_18]|uniref:DUF3795 domain-containing protein n=1 Tax=Candidatus Shapirobacteria bacterium CG07_land_8_20_14_0_80_39_18 TaxID=1974882 RepID=A0A2M6YS98_9BACT|nr:MAG: hypothetical protein COT03_00035 [Candidatus Shapirobacteria bacterium CG07_land_8_20_14_0_80_39_18]
MIKNTVVGACGVCCSTCRFFKTLNCKCSAGTEKIAQNKVKTNWGGRGILCLVCKCAVEKKVAYCTRDCGEFPCQKLRKWHFPYGEAYLKMYEQRKKEEK